MSWQALTSLSTSLPATDAERKNEYVCISYVLGIYLVGVMLGGGAAAASSLRLARLTVDTTRRRL